MEQDMEFTGDDAGFDAAADLPPDLPPEVDELPPFEEPVAEETPWVEPAMPPVDDEAGAELPPPLPDDTTPVSPPPLPPGIDGGDGGGQQPWRDMGEGAGAGDGNAADVLPPALPGVEPGAGEPLMPPGDGPAAGDGGIATPPPVPEGIDGGGGQDPFPRGMGGDAAGNGAGVDAPGGLDVAGVPPGGVPDDVAIGGAAGGDNGAGLPGVDGPADHPGVVGTDRTTEPPGPAGGDGTNPAQPPLPAGVGGEGGDIVPPMGTDADGAGNDSPAAPAPGDDVLDSVATTMTITEGSVSVDELAALFGADSGVTIQDSTVTIEQLAVGAERVVMFGEVDGQRSAMALTGMEDGGRNVVLERVSDRAQFTAPAAELQRQFDRQPQILRLEPAASPAPAAPPALEATPISVETGQPSAARTLGTAALGGVAVLPLVAGGAMLARRLKQRQA